MSNRAVFLDRDGTLIEHFDYLTDPQQVQLLPTVTTALRRLKEHGFYLVMATNQSAVARGMLTEKKLLKIHDHLKQMLVEEGAYLDQIFYCPFHPEGAVEKYRRDSDQRKPAPGMLLQAAQEMELDLKECWVVGDDDRDIETGRNAQCRTILLKTRHSPLVRRGGISPDFQAVNLLEAANLIIRYADQPIRDEPAQEEFEDNKTDQDQPDRIKPIQTEAPRNDSTDTKSNQKEKNNTTSNPKKKTRANSKRQKETKAKSDQREHPDLQLQQQNTPETAPVAPDTLSPDLKIPVFASPPRKIIPHEPLLPDEVTSPTPSREMAVSSVTEPQGTQTALHQDILAASRRKKTQSTFDEPSPANYQEDIQLPDQIIHEELSKTVRSHEIARRKASYKKITDSKPAAQKTETTQQLLAQILREIKAMNRRESFTEFSISKLMAGLVQMLVFFCLIMALWFISGRQPSPESAQVALLLAVVFQTLTLTLMMMRK